MASLESVPPDQRAVLQLVLQQGRTYDEIAQLLSIDRAAVRDRALRAFDAIGPQTQVPAERRALITDYLLGQLPGRVSDDVRNRLGESAGERAWARVLASELQPLSSGQLPEIPVGAAAQAEPRPQAVPASREPEPEPAAEAASRALRTRRPDRPETRRRPPREAGRPRPAGAPSPQTSRRGGALLLGAGALVVIAVIVVVIVVATSGGSSKHHASTGPRAGTTPGATPGATTTATNTSTGARVTAQITLTSPQAGSKTVGVAQVLRQGSNLGVAIVAQNVKPNTKHDAYAVWLYNSSSDAHLLGFVNPGVGSNGRLSTAGGLPANASHYKQLLVTLETQASPKAPGTIVLQGNLSGTS